MVPLAQAYDLGLSCEEPDVVNHQLCLGNKIFTYLAAGIPVLLTATPAQAALARDLGPAALLTAPRDVPGFSETLATFAADMNAIRCAKAAARAAAERRWHWEHDEDRGALLAEVANGLAA
jgi:hypothetical protein